MIPTLVGQNTQYTNYPAPPKMPVPYRPAMDQIYLDPQLVFNSRQL